MGLYLKSGYLNIRKMLSYGMVFNWLVGARGTGKTYGAAETAIEDHWKFIWMRRMQTATDEINSIEMSVFKSLNNDKNWDIYPFSAGKYSATYRHGKFDDKGKLNPYGDILGMTTSLSTVAHLRGVDLSDYDYLIYDEFIPEQHEKAMKHEGEAFSNAYETINRNRELQGKPALKVLGMANSNDLGNPLFVEYGLVEAAIKLQKSKSEFLLIPERSTALFMPKNSPISAAKADTALYRMTSGRSFQSMALKNAFLIEGEDTIRSMDIRGMKPIVTVGVLTVYEDALHDGFYISFHHSGTIPVFRAERIELLRFKNQYMHLWAAHMEKRIFFETYSAQKIFEEYYKTT